MMVYVLVEITNEVDPQKLQLNDLLVCVLVTGFRKHIILHTYQSNNMCTKICSTPGS